MTQTKNDLPPALKHLSDAELDSMLDDYLEGGSQLSTTYRHESDSLPAAHIDSAVLHAARHQVEQRAQRGGWLSWLSPAGWSDNNWLVPAVSACGVVAIVATFTTLQPDSDAPLPGVPASGVDPSMPFAPNFASAAEYVDAIQLARERGDLDGADELTREVRRVYPDYPLPPKTQARIDD